CGVRADTHAAVPFVFGEIIDSVGRDFAKVLVDEVVYSSLDRRAARTPLPTLLVKVTNEFLLLRVNGDHWFPVCDHVGDEGIQISELPIAVRVRRPLVVLSHRLEPIALLLEERSHCRVGDLETRLLQGSRQLSDALGRPAERSFRIPSDPWRYESLERLDDARLLLAHGFPTRAGSTYAADGSLLVAAFNGLELGDRTVDRAPSHPRRFADPSHATPPEFASLGCHPSSPRALIKQLLHGIVLAPQLRYG